MIKVPIKVNGHQAGVKCVSMAASEHTVLACHVNNKHVVFLV
jgi:hypothetical protein